MFVNNIIFRKFILKALALITLLIILFKLQSSSIEFYGNMNEIIGLNDNINNSDKPLHVFIDLGANSGDTIYNFVGMNSKSLGGNLNSQNFPKSFKKAKWIIYGFEANSAFDQQLMTMKQDVEKSNHLIHLYNSTAAWIYDGTIDFYVDNNTPGFVASSINKNHVINKFYNKLKFKHI